ncbi:MAG: hypothetical protein ACRDS9_02230 [Pseudonocardiaceae bacterium]
MWTPGRQTVRMLFLPLMYAVAVVAGVVVYRGGEAFVFLPLLLLLAIAIGTAVER